MGTQLTKRKLEILNKEMINQCARGICKGRLGNRESKQPFVGDLPVILPNVNIEYSKVLIAD